MSTYLDKLIDLEDQMNHLNIEIREKLYSYTIKYPNIIIDVINNTHIKAKSISNKTYINTINIKTCIKYIDTIEKQITNF